MLSKIIVILSCFVLTLLFSGCTDFEYSEPGAYGYYEPHYYYDRYPHYYHGPEPRHYVHAFRSAPHGHTEVRRGNDHDGHR